MRYRSTDDAVIVARDPSALIVICEEIVMPAVKEPSTVQFVTNSAGEKTAVIVPLADYQELLEDLSDLAAVAERRDEPTVSHDELLSELKRDGHLPD